MRAGLTLRGLVQRMSPAVSPQAIRKYEEGEMVPSADTLISLAAALNVSLDSLMNSDMIASHEASNDPLRRSTARIEARHSKEFFGQRLKLARKNAGLSLQDLGESLSPRRSVQTINNYEQGVRVPSAAVLQRLSETLGVSLDELLNSVRPRVRGLSFHRQSVTWGWDSTAVEEAIREQLTARLELEAILGRESERPLFDVPQVVNLQSLPQVEQVAVNLRRSWQLGNGPILSMTDILEEAGVKVIEAAIPDKLGALSCTVSTNDGDADVEVVVVSALTKIEHKRLSLARELGRRLIRARDPHVQVEAALEKFAAAFLIPTESLRWLVGSNRRNLGKCEVADLTRRYGVSANVIFARLANAGLLPRAAVKTARRNFRPEHSSIGKEPQSPFSAFEESRHHARLAHQALAEGLISSFKAERLVRDVAFG